MAFFVVLSIGTVPETQQGMHEIGDQLLESQKATGVCGCRGCTLWKPAMKKVSIAAVRQGRNISHPKLTTGLDLGDRNSWYCVLNEAGQIQLEQRVRTNAKALREVFGSMPRSRIALETGMHRPGSADC
jgi:hypothetical protein